MIIRGGLAALPGLDEPVRADITITDGTITSISMPARGDGSDNATAANHEIIDASGLLVLPGAIDPHVHFDDPGYTEREDFSHGCAAAASGGVTAIIDMPSTSVPPVTSSENLHRKLEVVSRKAVIDFGFFGGVSGQVFESGVEQAMAGLAPDVLGFKSYFVSGMDTFRALNHRQFLEAVAIASRLGRPVLLHAEDASFVAAATDEVLESGGILPADYERSRPEAAEILAVSTAAELARIAAGGGPVNQAPVHVVHVSTARAAELIGQSPSLTGETGPQYLEFGLAEFEQIGSALKVTPPPKPAPNAQGLWEALLDGRLDFAASDHAPSPTEQKSTGSIWTDYAGIPGTATLLPYLFSAGYASGRMPLSRLLAVTSGAAAARYGLSDRKGALRVGMDGDCVLIDPRATWKVVGEKLLSKGKVTPFDGMELTGRVARTIVRGRTVYDQDRGIVAEPGSGRFLTRTKESTH